MKTGTLAAIAVSCIMAVGICGCGDKREDLKATVKEAMLYFGFEEDDVIKDDIRRDCAAIDRMNDAAPAYRAFKDAFEQVKSQSYNEEQKKLVEEIGQRIMEPDVTLSMMPLEYLETPQPDVMHARIEIMKKLIPGTGSVFEIKKELDSARKICIEENNKIAELIGFKYWKDAEIESATLSRLKAERKEMSMVGEILKDSGLNPGMMAKAAKFTKQYAGMDVRDSFRDLIGNYLKNRDNPGIRSATEIGLKSIVDAASSALKQVEREEAQKEEGTNQAVSELLDNELILRLRFKGSSEKDCNDLKRKYMEEFKAISVERRLETARKRIAEAIRKYNL